MTNFLCFVIALHVVSFANLYVIKNLNLNLNTFRVINYNFCLQSQVLRKEFAPLGEHSFLYGQISFQRASLSRETNRNSCKMI